MLTFYESCDIGKFGPNRNDYSSGVICCHFRGCHIDHFLNLFENLLLFLFHYRVTQFENFSSVVQKLSGFVYFNFSPFNFYLLFWRLLFGYHLCFRFLPFSFAGALWSFLGFMDSPGFFDGLITFLSFEPHLFHLDLYGCRHDFWHTNWVYWLLLSHSCGFTLALGLLAFNRRVVLNDLGWLCSDRSFALC